MKITVCIGSSCHLKGARQIVEKLQELIVRDRLGKEVELGGTFCMGKCESGVCVTVDEDLFQLEPAAVSRFYEETVRPRAASANGGN